MFDVLGTLFRSRLRPSLFSHLRLSLFLGALRGLILGINRNGYQKTPFCGSESRSG